MKRRHRYFVIFGAMRTGSNLLETSLDQYEGLKGLGELFNPSFITGPGRDALNGLTLEDRRRDPIGFLEAAIAAEPDRIVGFRLFDGHEPRVLDHAARDPDCAKIILRRDPIDSFLSLNIAKETGQWLLRKEQHRRLAKTRFDQEAFEAYRDKLSAHYVRLRAAVRAAGEPTFEIDFDELRSVDLINGAARFIGSSERKERVKQVIHRQNPGARIDKVENPEALLAYTPSTSYTAEPVEALRFSALENALAVRGVEAVFAPVPGAGDDAVVDMLRAIAPASDDGEPKVAVGMQDKHVGRRRRRGAFFFAFVRHPVDRIWSAYQELPERHPAAQALLERDYGAPPGAASAADFDVAMIGFDAFLAFVTDNIAGRTQHAQEPLWTPQSRLLADYAHECPPDFIGRCDRAEEDARYVLDRLDVAEVDARAIAATFADAVSAKPSPPEGALTSERLRVIRDLYERDFLRLGFR